MSLTLLCAWEDARVWACWNHPFDMHLHYLGPVLSSPPILSPSGYTVRGGCHGWELGWGHPVCLWYFRCFLSSDYWLEGGGAIVAWWLSILCFLIMAGSIFHSHWYALSLHCGVWASLSWPPSCCVWPTPSWWGPHSFYTGGAQRVLLCAVSTLPPGFSPLLNFPL